MTFPTPRSYKTHNYCKKCAIWFKISVIGNVLNCPDCGYKIRKKAHSSLSKSEAGKIKNMINQTKTRAGISLI